MDHADTLRALAAQYEREPAGRRAKLNDLRALAGGYIKARGTSIMDAAAIGFAFDVVFSESAFDVSKITPEMASAWEQAYPNVSIESLAGRSTEDLAGAISGWKGKLFEVEVANRLNAGEWVGNLHLEAGQHAQLAASATQPGWDLQILNGDGSVADALQLKATESVRYVHEALERYPDTPILATHEVASKLIDHGTVIDSGLHNDILTESVSEHVADASADAFSDGLIGAMPVSIIVVTEAARVLSGKKTVDAALASGGDRLAKGVLAGAVAAGVSVVATPFVGAIAGFMTRLFLSSEPDVQQAPEKSLVPPDMDRMRNVASRCTDVVHALEPFYPCPARASRPKPNAFLNDRQELLSLVDSTTRLAIVRGSMPLNDWIESMVARDTSSLDEPALTQHLADLQQIQRERWVDKAFPASGFLDQLGRAFAGNHGELTRKLGEAIKLQRLLLKKFSGELSQADVQQIEHLQMTPTERYALEAMARVAAIMAKRGIQISQAQVAEIMAKQGIQVTWIDGRCVVDRSK